MKLYTSPFAPNGLKVLILAQEKGLEIETVTLGPDDKADYLKINPFGQVPSLLLEDGTAITESLTICQYVDAISSPPALFGEGLEERTRIAMWERRAEMLLFIPGVEYGHHTHPMFAGSIAQHPDWARDMLPKSLRMIELMEEQLTGYAYLAGDDFTAADITACLGYFMLLAYGAIERGDRVAIRGWTARVMERPSMNVLKQMAQAFGVENIFETDGSAAVA